MQPGNYVATNQGVNRDRVADDESQADQSIILDFQAFSTQKKKINK